MILTGPQIAREVAAGTVRIDDFDPTRLEPNSYGFRLGDEMLVHDGAVLDTHAPPEHRRLDLVDGAFHLEPGRFYLGATAEAMGSTGHAAELYACRSVSTLGVWIQFSAPLGHCGAVIPWTLEIAVAHRVRLYPGMVIGKIAFWTMAGAPLAYDGRYAGSAGVVRSRLCQDAPSPVPFPTAEQVLVR